MIAGYALYQLMQKRVEERLSPEQRFDNRFFFPENAKWFQVANEYRRLYPSGGLHSLSLLSTITGLALICVSVPLI